MTPVLLHSAQDVWPVFEAPKITHSSSEKYNLPCPYILSKSFLGTGSYANVYECKNTITGTHYAAKRFEKRLIYGHELMLQREFQVLKAVLNEHRNILLMVDYFETSDYFFLVTDLATGGELFERITKAPEGKLSVGETQKILAKLLSALAHLHKNGVAHRDIKSENILFSSRNSSLLLLADFGHAIILKPGELAESTGGTLSYLAPEVVSRHGHSFPVDLWAVGVLTYFMLSGYMPFDCDTDEETKELILKADYVFDPPEYWDHIPQTAKDFISKCFVVDPQARITAQNALEHPFVAEVCEARPHLTPAISSTSLSKLQDAVWKMHASREKSSSNLASLSPLRYNAISSYSSRFSLDRMDHAVLGERCYSPETVTAFTTPITSASASRQHSLSSIAQSPKMSALAATQMGSANFVI